MRRATTTNPRSYSQPFLTLRATACTARRTGYGTVGLFGFNIPCSVPAGFVAEHRSKLRPRCIERRFTLCSIRKRCCNYIADYDGRIFSHNLGRLHMQIMPTGIANLGMDRPCALLVSGALRSGERIFVSLEVARMLDLAAIRQGRQRRQAEIDADFASATILLCGNLDLQTEIPPFASVLGKATSFDRSVYRPTIPETITALEIDNGIAFNLNSTRSLKWNPSERALAAPVRAPLSCIAANGELLADSLNRIAVQAEHLATAACELDQIKAVRPPFFLSPCCLLRLTTEVPDDIDGTRQAIKILAGRCVFEAIAISKDHPQYLIRSATTMQGFRRERHSVSRLTVHLVCVTKYRRKVLDRPALDWLKAHFAKLCEQVSCTMHACDGEADHVHLLVEYPP